MTNTGTLVKRIVSTLSLTTVAVGLSALPAQANLQGYSGINLVGQLWAAQDAAYIDIPDDMTSSLGNNTNSDFSGQNVDYVWHSHEIFFANSWSSYDRLGDANNKIDHFDRR